MTLPKRASAKCRQPRVLLDAHKAVQTLKDANCFQGVLLDRLEKAIAQMQQWPRPSSAD